MLSCLNKNFKIIHEYNIKGIEKFYIFPEEF